MQLKQLKVLLCFFILRFLYHILSRNIFLNVLSNCKAKIHLKKKIKLQLLLNRQHHRARPTKLKHSFGWLFRKRGAQFQLPLQCTSFKVQCTTFKVLFYVFYFLQLLSSIQSSSCNQSFNLISNLCRNYMLKESKQIPVFPDIKPLTKHAVSPFPYPVPMRLLLGTLMNKVLLISLKIMSWKVCIDNNNSTQSICI